MWVSEDPTGTSWANALESNRILKPTQNREHHITANEPKSFCGDERKSECGKGLQFQTPLSAAERACILGCATYELANHKPILGKISRKKKCLFTKGVFFIIITFYLLPGVGTGHVVACIWIRGQPHSSGIPFAPSITWVLVIKLRLSGLVASTFPH